MRTTVRLDASLLADAKATAARTGRTLTGVIEDALRESFARTSAPDRRAAPALPIFEGNGLQDGVDLDDTAALLDLMEPGRR